MAKGRKTKPLVYNLNDRGRRYTGVDRSNVDIAAMVNLINSASVQEMVSTGSLQGFYGHQIRQRFGMVPPESVPIDGKMVRLEPAFKTISIHADKDGNVTHQAQFLDNETGEFARKQYLAEVGGFSTAVNYRRDGGQLVPTGFFGFDYVMQPNYALNVGDGELFDGLFVPEHQEGLISCFDSATDIQQLSASQAMIARMLEEQITREYDNIHAQITLMQHANSAYDQVAVMHQQMGHLERKKVIQAQRQVDLYTGMVGEIRSFDSVCEEANAILSKIDKPEPEQKPEVKKKRFFGFSNPWGIGG